MILGISNQNGFSAIIFRAQYHLATVQSSAPLGQPTYACSSPSPVHTGLGGRGAALN